MILGGRAVVAATPVLMALFGGSKEKHRIDLVVVIVAGLVTVIVWSVGAALIAYRLLPRYDAPTPRARVVVGALVFLTWTVAVVFAAVWIVD